MVSIGSGELKLSGKELGTSEPKRPILVCVRYESHNNVAWRNTASISELLHQRFIECFLHGPTARTGRDLKDHPVRSSLDAETGILDDHSGWLMFSDDLIAVAFRHVEGVDHHLVGDVQYPFDLAFRTPLN